MLSKIYNDNSSLYNILDKIITTLLKKGTAIYVNPNKTNSKLE